MVLFVVRHVCAHANMNTTIDAGKIMEDDNGV